MLYSPQPPAPLVQDWMERHRDPRSFVLHLIGIPCTILGVLMMPIYTIQMSLPLLGLALLLFLGGFGVQFLGHAIDGSEPGEIRGIRVWWSRRRAIRPVGALPRVAFPDVKRG